MSNCRYCGRADAGLHCDDDHCRELPAFGRIEKIAPIPPPLIVEDPVTGEAAFYPPQPEPVYGRCDACNGILTDDSECLDPDCTDCQ